MNEVMKALLDRRSIRQYEDKAVPAELIEQIVEAGLHAPSSMGKQNSKIVVITNIPNVQKGKRQYHRFPFLSICKG